MVQVLELGSGSIMTLLLLTISVGSVAMACFMCYIAIQDVSENCKCRSFSTVQAEHHHWRPVLLSATKVLGPTESM